MKAGHLRKFNPARDRSRQTQEHRLAHFLLDSRIEPKDCNTYLHKPCMEGYQSSCFWNSRTTVTLEAVEMEKEGSLVS